MSVENGLTPATERDLEDAIRTTRTGVIERLSDPYLADHDRWVLGQFACFLGGRTPGPDPRTVRVRRRRTF